MPVIITPESELGKELVKWEQHRTKYVGDEQQPGNPYVFRAFPTMLYKAFKRPNGAVECLLPAPDLYAFATERDYERACLEVDSFNRRCVLTVGSAAEVERQRAEGWRETPDAAKAFVEGLEQDIAQAAAEAAAAVRRMSPAAQGEYAAAEATTEAHVTDVVPRRRRGRAVPRARRPVTGTVPTIE